MSQQLAAVVTAALLVVAGCGAVPGGTDGEQGTVSFYVSDQANAIDDFEHLNVTVTGVAFAEGNATNDSDAEWQTYDVNATVDLTRLKGENATRIGNLSVPTGEYGTVKLNVSNVEGTLDDGSEANVKLPSGGLKVPKGLTVRADEPVSFVFDVSVVKSGQSGRYVLKPVIGESGTDVPIDPRGQQRRGSSERGNAPDSRMNLYLSDETNAVDEFRSLNVTVTSVGIHPAGDAESESDANESGANETDGNETDANETDGGSAEAGGWQNYEVNETTIDLTEYKGANATLLDTLDVSAGTYDKVFVHVDEVNGTLKTGEQVNVKLPSEKLHINSEFTVGNNESVDFVFDISVFKAGNSGKYILKPVVSESGTDVPIEVKGEGSAKANASADAGGNTTADAGGNASADAGAGADMNGTSDGGANATVSGNATAEADVNQSA